MIWIATEPPSHARMVRPEKPMYPQMNFVNRNQKHATRPKVTTAIAMMNTVAFRTAPSNFCRLPSVLHKRIRPTDQPTNRPINQLNKYVNDIPALLIYHQPRGLIQATSGASSREKRNGSSPCPDHQDPEFISKILFNPPSLV